MAWCRRGDLNPHGLPHTPLKRACLPVPPLRPKSRKSKNVSQPRRGTARLRCASRVAGKAAADYILTSPPPVNAKGPLPSSVANLLEWPCVKESAMAPDDMEDFELPP